MMINLEVEETKRNVAEMLKAHLPRGWAYRVKVSPRAEHLAPAAVTPNDLSWLIWRPRDIGNLQRCYRLELVGTSGHEFVLTHGNSDGPGPRPEMATLFSTWTADLALSAIVAGHGIYGPNRFGLS